LRQIQGDNNDGFFTEGMIVMNRYIKEIKDNCQYVSGYRKQLKIKEIKAFEAKLNVYYEPLKAIKKLASLKE